MVSIYLAGLTAEDDTLTQDLLLSDSPKITDVPMPPLRFTDQKAKIA